MRAPEPADGPMARKEFVKTVYLVKLASHNDVIVADFFHCLVGAGSGGAANMEGRGVVTKRLFSSVPLKEGIATYCSTSIWLTQPSTQQY